MFTNRFTRSFALLFFSTSLLGATLSFAEDSTIPVSPELAEKVRLENLEAKISVMPGEGFEQSSIPVGHPRCLPGQGCPEPGVGGRVRFWFVSLDLVHTEAQKEGAIGADGAGVSSGLFYMRRRGHGFYEFRNIVGVSFAEGKPDDPQTTLHSRAQFRADFSNGAYYSALDDDTEKHPFTVILGGKTTARSGVRGNLPGTLPLTAAFQLSGGFLINFDTANVKVTGDLDLLRTTVALVADDELGTGSEGERRNLSAKPFRGWGVQTTIASGPISIIAEVGHANYRGEYKEATWRGGFDITSNSGQIHDDEFGTFRGFFWTVGAAGGSYRAVVPTGSEAGLKVHALEFDLRAAIGFKTW